MTTLDETIVGGQAGHITDHDYIAAVTNRMKHIVQVTISATSNVTNDNETTINWDSEVSDVFGYHAGSSSQLIVPAGTPTGWYRATLSVGFPSNSTGVRQAYIAADTGQQFSASSPAVTGRRTDLMAQGLVLLAAGNYIEGHAYQNSSGTLALSATNTRMSLQRVCDA